MKTKAAALLVANFGVNKSHSESYTSNDNPFWESHFKTLKCQTEVSSTVSMLRSASVWRNLLLSQPPSAMSACAEDQPPSPYAARAIAGMRALIAKT
jgi:hypothetical protein